MQSQQQSPQARGRSRRDRSAPESGKVAKRSAVSKRLKDPTIDSAQMKAKEIRKRKGIESIQRIGAPPLKKRPKAVSTARSKKVSEGNEADGRRCLIEEPKSMQYANPGSMKKRSRETKKLSSVGRFPSSSDARGRAEDDAYSEEDDSDIDDFESLLKGGKSSQKSIIKYLDDIDSDAEVLPQSKVVKKTKESRSGSKRTSDCDDDDNNGEGQSDGEAYELDVAEAHRVGRGFNGLEDGSDIEGENDPILQALRLQEARMDREKKLMVSTRRPSQKGPKFRTRRTRQLGLSTEDAWTLEYESKPKAFFHGPVAQLLVPLRVKTTNNGRMRCEAFRGVPVTEENNSDVCYVFNNKFGGLVNTNTGPEAYSQFKIAVGQLLRVALGMGRVDAADVWEPGQLFRIAEIKPLFVAFLGHFVGPGSSPPAVWK